MKRLISWFVRWYHELKRYEKVFFFFGVTLALLTSVTTFLLLDKVPATALDYVLLEKQVIAIQQNPKLLFEAECNVTFSHDGAKLSLENDQCRILAEYDNNFQLISTEKVDKSFPWYVILLLSLIAFIVGYCCGFVIIPILITGVFLIADVLCEFVKKKK